MSESGNVSAPPTVDNSLTVGYWADLDHINRKLNGCDIKRSNLGTRCTGAAFQIADLGGQTAELKDDKKKPLNEAELNRAKTELDSLDHDTPKPTAEIEALAAHLEAEKRVEAELKHLIAPAATARQKRSFDDGLIPPTLPATNYQPEAVVGAFFSEITKWFMENNFVDADVPKAGDELTMKDIIAASYEDHDVFHALTEYEWDYLDQLDKWADAQHKAFLRRRDHGLVTTTCPIAASIIDAVRNVVMETATMDKEDTIIVDEDTSSAPQ